MNHIKHCKVILPEGFLGFDKLDEGKAVPRTVRMTDEEYREVRIAAAKCNTGVADFVRNIMRQVAAQVNNN